MSIIVSNIDFNIKDSKYELDWEYRPVQNK